MKKINDIKEIEKFYKKLNIDVDNKKEKTNENIFKKFIGIYDKNKTSYLDYKTILKNGWVIMAGWNSVFKEKKWRFSISFGHS